MIAGMTNLVSIIMPAYNAEKYISQSIQSIQDQTYQNWELIVIDDGSTDETARVVQSLAKLEPRIKYIHQQNSKLPARVRNTGIGRASGELIAFLDSDDLWLKEKLAAQVETLTETASDVVFSDSFYFFGDDWTDESKLLSSFYRRVVGRLDGPSMMRLLLRGNPIPVLSVLTRKSMLDAVGGYNDDPAFWGCDEYELWFRLARHGAIFYGMDAVLGRYRVHRGAMSRNRARILLAEVSVIEEHIPESGPDRRAAEKRLKHIYRELMTALAEDNRFEETRDYLTRLSRWDRYGAVTQLQRILIRLSPRRYERISQRLYILERHARSIKDIRGQRTIRHVKNLWRKLIANQA